MYSPLIGMTTFHISEETITDLNRELACLRFLVVNMGAGRRDTREMREKLTKCRRRCMDICRETRSSLPGDCDRLTPDMSEDGQRRLSSLCIALQQLSKEMRILQRLSAAFPEKSVKSLFHYPATFMLLDGSAARMMDPGAPSNSAEAMQIYRERKEVLDLLRILGYDPSFARFSDTSGANNTDMIFEDYHKKSLLKRGTFGVKSLLCCRRDKSYL